MTTEQAGVLADEHLERGKSTQSSSVLTDSQQLLRAWQALTFILLVAATALLGLGLTYAPRAIFPPAQAALGYNGVASHFQSLPAHRVTGFEPESPLPSAGIAVGDLIVDPPRGTLVPAETVKLRIARNGAVRNIEVRAAPIGRLTAPVKIAFDYGLDALMLILGVTIAVRRRRDVAALALACALQLGAGGQVPNVLPPGRLAGFLDLWGTADGVLIFAAVAYFLLKFDGGYRSRARPYLLGAVGTLFGAWSVWIIVMMTPYYLGRIWVSPDAVFGPAISAGDIAATMLCVLVSVDVWRHVGRESRQRLRWLFFAVALALAGFTLVVLADLLGITQTSQTAVLAFQVAADIAYGAAVLALIYAVLRHRVMDIGLAVSRTLVFAIFSGLLLFLFGTVEWLLDHFLHFEQRERSFLLDGVIAVGVYAAFHRARDGIQSVVERVFFREWHAREAALQHFLETTPHFSDADALADALLAAVDAYTGSPGSGIYRRNDAGSFILDKSKLDHLPQELGSDASLIIELKASRTPYYFARVGDAATTLAVPMVRRSELVGFLVVAQKADCTLYRPAEIDNLVRAIHQVSSDLYALRVERLERRQRELEQQNEALRQQFRSLAVSEPRNS